MARGPRGTAPRRRLSTAVGAGVLAVTGLVAASGCTARTTTAPSSPPPATPLARLNTAQLQLHRIPFCDLLPRAAVTDALGARATEHASWDNGDTSSFVGGRGDRAQEFGCRFSADSAVAEAWVFASPVDGTLAAQAIHDASRQPGCRDVVAPDFGRPSQELLCHLDGGVAQVRHAGLFGDTWLTCQVAAPLSDAQVTRRADAWCVQVASAINTAR